MFFRKKKVGPHYYIQIVESKRTPRGPRLTVRASLGRADKLEDEGVITKLANSIFKLAAENSPIDYTAPKKTREFPKDEFRTLIARKVSAKFRFAKPLEKLLGNVEDTEKLLGLVQRLWFDSLSKNEGNDLVKFGECNDLFNFLRNDVAPTIDNDQPFILHIGQAYKAGTHQSLLSGTAAATLVSQDGTPLYASGWPEHLPLPVMIEAQFAKAREAFPEREIVIVIDRAFVNKRLVGWLHVNNVKFIVPLREPANTLIEPPSRIQEERIPAGPFHEIGKFRHIRCIDMITAAHDSHFREMKLAKLRQISEMDPRFSKVNGRLEEQIEDMSIWDGSTMIATNIDATPDDCILAYIAGQKAAAFQHDLHKVCAELMEFRCLPRQLDPLINGLTQVKVIADILADEFLGRVSKEANSKLAWQDIRKAIVGFAPIIAQDGRQEKLVTPPNNAVMDDILASLNLDINLVESIICKSDPSVNEIQDNTPLSTALGHE